MAVLGIGFTFSLNYLVGSTITQYSGTPLNGHPSIADTHDITDNSESPDCLSIHFNT